MNAWRRVCGPIFLAKARSAGDAADDSAGAVPIQPCPGGSKEDGAVAAFADDEVYRPGGPRREGDHGFLAALAGDGQGAVPAFGAKRQDVGAGGFGDPQSVQGEQRDEGMFGSCAKTGDDQEGADLVTVQAGDVGLVVQPGTADVHCRGVSEQFLFDGVAVEPGDGGQPAGDRGSGPPCGFEVAAEAFDVGSACGEQSEMMELAPGGELAQVQGVGFPGQAGVPGQEIGYASCSGSLNTGRAGTRADDVVVVDMGTSRGGPRPAVSTASDHLKVRSPLQGRKPSASADQHAPDRRIWMSIGLVGIARRARPVLPVRRSHCERFLVAGEPAARTTGAS
jgi:hypothetical protein